MSSDRWVQAFPDAYAEVVSHEVNGNSLDLDYVQEVEVVDGMIVHMTARYDMQAMMSQLGLG